MERIVISGIAATFPESKNVEELQYNLYNKIDMVTDRNNRWDIDHPEIPKRTGKIPNIEKFDAGFFGVHYRQAETMDPMLRLILEKSIEAIFDAGLHPSELEGSNTGVFIGSSFSETEATLFPDVTLEPQNFPVTGSTRSIIANRISYYLKLKGPSFNADTACSSSLIALVEAFQALRKGTCEQAIVGGCNLCLHPYVTLQFSKLGVLSKEGKCKVFDEDGNGYVRSEAGGVIFLQKIKNAKRNYGEVVYCKSNCDGFTSESIHFPSKYSQSQLLKECYEESGLHPDDLSYLEAHGTATYVGDPEEVASIDSVICANRSKPLLVGSVKSNVGHSEPSSGLTSIIKSILIMENKVIPPNLHYNKPRAGVEALENGRLQVITENTKLEDRQIVIGISSFGFGGGNAHAILRSNVKEKHNKGVPQDDLPRLICVSGRVKEAVINILDDLKKRELDNEYVGLYHGIFKKAIEGHWYRGYSILSKYGELSRSLGCVSNNRKKVCVVFGDSNKTWLEIIKELLKITIFREVIELLHHRLLEYQIILLDVIENHAKNTREIIFGTAAAQIAFISVLKSLKIEPDYYIGIGVGELVCAFIDNCLSLDETIQAIHQVVLIKEQNGVKLVDNSKKKITFKAKSNKWLTSNREILSSASPEYFADSVLYTIKENLKLLESNQALICIGDVALNQHFEKRNFEILEVRNHTESVLVTFLQLLGSLYKMGFDMELDKLYPKIEFPVSRGTPMIAPLIKWNHAKDHFVALYKPKDVLNLHERVCEVDLADDKWSFVTGHMIEERNLFPATGYLYLVLETLAIKMKRHISDMKVVFENCKFLRATTVSVEKKVAFSVSIQNGSGQFEIVESGSVVVNGQVYVHDDLTNEFFDQLPTNQNKNENNTFKLDSRDIYKELRLRGYNYKGEFRQVQQISLDLSHALIRWNQNWIAFMDNLLQTKILHLDSRALFVPTRIDRLIIDTKRHVQYCLSFEHETPNMPVFIYNKINIIKSGGIEIRGLNASPIAKKKILEEPVLEKYQFIPNETVLNLEEAVRVNVQIAIENVPGIKIKVVEVVQKDFDTDHILSPLINKMLLDLPAIQPEVVMLSDQKLELDGVSVANRRLAIETDCNIVVGHDLFENQTCLQDALSALKENGFILSRESCDFDDSQVIRSNSLEIFTVYTINNKYKLIFAQKALKKSNSPAPILIDISNTADLSWLKLLQTTLSSRHQDIIIYSQEQPLSGIMGLVNCIRREPGKNNIKCVFIVDPAPQFDPKHCFYQTQLAKNMAINVYKDAKWGTFRHLELQQDNRVLVEHCFVHNLVRGDLSSLRWIQGPLKSNSTNDDLIHVYYAALNFKDVMIASGRINAASGDRLLDEYQIGFEFAGKTSSGVRVMGVNQGGALTTLIKNNDAKMIWEIPDDWSLEDAATIPCVYMTVLYAIFVRSHLKKEHSILVHSGAGGIGIATINLALNLGCRVFTTVGTKEKREFLKQTFTQLTDDDIFNSRDTSFEEAIHRATKGRGVDFIINSLSDDKLLASIRCLAKFGTFLEIGKYDILNDSRLNLILIEKQASFHGIMLDLLMVNSNSDAMNQLHALMVDGIRNGSIRPLPRNVFNRDEIEQAFRYMTTGKHIGKNLIKIREEDGIGVMMREAVSRYFCCEDGVYVIVGGLGGFGLELADWLVLRGARKLVLTSRRGVTTGYQALRLKIWQSYDVAVKISTADITTREGCHQLITESKHLGNKISAIFNLAVILQDAIIENQTCESFKTSLGPKADATQHLDDLTRLHCPDLSDFVVFSSVSCGRGNAGQSNYGFSNSIMERICEKRRLDGYPGLAIEWGAIGDVGIVADMQEEHLTEMEIGGTLQQRITSCLQVLDVFLTQKESAVVSSIVVAKKKSKTGCGGSLVDVVAAILGIKNLKTVSMQLKLSELGMDSMTAVEIQQTLERDFQCLLSAQEIRNLTFTSLKELQDELSEMSEKKSSEGSKGLLDILSKFIADEQTASLPLITLPSKSDKISKDTQFIFFPGIEGSAKTLESLSRNLSASSKAIQFTPENTKSSIEETVDSILPLVQDIISSQKTFRIIAYSYGTVPALEIAARLEKQGYEGTIICIDASPLMITAMHKHNDKSDEAQFQTYLILHAASFIIPQDIVMANSAKISECHSLDEKLDVIRDIVPDDCRYSRNFVREAVGAVYRRVSILKGYTPSYKLKSKVILCKPTEPVYTGMSEDYGLSEICAKPVDVKIFKGNHVNVVENLDLADAIMQLI